MKLKKIVVVCILTIGIGHGLIAPATAIPGWRFLRELITGSDPEVGNPRVGADPNIPYIISPRKTAILTPTPRFRWNSVTAASTYTVTLRGPDGIVWESVVEDHEIIYPGTPTLEPDIPYSLTIKTELSPGADGVTTVTSTDEGIPGLSFYLLPQAEIDQLRLELATIAQQNLTPLEATLKQARLYRDYNLMDTAIALLESFRRERSCAIEISRLLGELYLQVSLNTFARDAFTEARRLASETENLVAQADASVFLAYLALGSQTSDEAIQLLHEAQTLYSSQNESEKAEAVADLLATFQ